MTTVEYRPIRQGDVAAVTSMISEAFPLDRFARHPKVLGSVREMYLRHCLAQSTWSRVAVVDGRPVGVILARIGGQPARAGAWRHRAVAAWHLGRAIFFGMADRAQLRTCRAVAAAYRELRGEVTTPLTDEVTLFVVDASMRGQGIGKRLFGDMMLQLRQAGRCHFHVFTDTLRSFGFYDRQGMRRAAQRTIDLTFGGGAEQVGVFLYRGEIPQLEHAVRRQHRARARARAHTAAAGRVSSPA